MNQKQQELYDKLLKKVNEYCLGAAAEDVIAAIDALVDTYETPKKRISKTKDQLLVENEFYQLMFHQVRYYVESKEFSLEDLAKRLKALEIIWKKEVIIVWLKICFKEVNGFEEYNKCSNLDLTEEEYELLKEILK